MASNLEVGSLNAGNAVMDAALPVIHLKASANNTAVSGAVYFTEAGAANPQEVVNSYCGSIEYSGLNNQLVMGCYSNGDAKPGMKIARDTGLCSFANGIEVTGHGSASDTNYTKFTATQSQTVTIADDASITISATAASGALVSVYAGNGKAILFFLAWSPIAQIINDADSMGSAGDIDGRVCLIKGTTTHACTLKNRLGVSSIFHITVFGGYVA